MDQPQISPGSPPRPAMADAQPNPREDPAANYTPSFSNLHYFDRGLAIPNLIRAVNTDPQAVANYIIALEARVRKLEKRVVVHHNTMQQTKVSCERMARQLQSVVRNEEQGFEKSFRKMGGLERDGVFEGEQMGEQMGEQTGGQMGGQLGGLLYRMEGWEADSRFGLMNYERVEVRVEAEDRGEGLPDYVSEDGVGCYGGFDGGLEVYGMNREEIDDGDLGQECAGEDAEMDVDEEEADDEDYADTPPSPPSPSLIRV